MKEAAAAFAVIFLVAIRAFGAGDPLFEKGLRAARFGNHAVAAEAFRASALAQPSSERLQNLGIAEWLSGRTGPAVLAWEQALWLDSFNQAGVALGSGALLICNEETCVVDLARVLMNFFKVESCGKCTPCRIGNERAYSILTNISEGTAVMKDLDDLMTISDNLFQLSNCGLGQTSGTPIRDILKYFRAEVEAHIKLKVCPSGVCSMSGQLQKISSPAV